jgi:drug/metabolite transporter (DMT)-like permease
MDGDTAEPAQTAGQRQGLGILVTVLATVALAANNVAIPVVYSHSTTPTAMLLVRYAVLIAGLYTVLRLTGRAAILPARFRSHAAIAGALSCLGSLGLITAYGLIPVSLALVILYVYPILTAIGQSLIERKPVSLGLFVCLILAFTGLAIALGAGGDGFVRGFDLAGVLCALGGAVSFAGFFLWSRYGLSGADPGTTALNTSLAGLFLAAIASAGFNFSGLMPFHAPGFGDGVGWLAMLWVSVCFSLAYFGMTWGVQLAGATSATMLMNLETVFTLPLAAYFLAETLDARRLTGAGLVLASVVASQILATRKAHS